MLNKTLLQKFCTERNLTESTARSYESALKHYIKYHKLSFEDLLQEAKTEENKKIPLKERKIKKRLLEYRSHMQKSKLTPNTIRTYFNKIKTLYIHFDIEIPPLPTTKYNKTYQTSYLDLPTREHIQKACDNTTLDLKAIILFMSSSGTSKSETLSITIKQFIQATKNYHNGGTIKKILKTLSTQKNIIPTFYLKRNKTNKYYYTFCTPEATQHIINYLHTRKNLKPQDKLFDIKPSTLSQRFTELNDKMNWGFKGNYRFFRAHTLRKYHASNIGLSAEYVDELQGRTKNQIHETYIKTNPDKLKTLYTKVMNNVIIYNTEPETINQEFTIVINIFLAGKEYTIQ